MKKRSSLLQKLCHSRETGNLIVQNWIHRLSGKNGFSVTGSSPKMADLPLIFRVFILSIFFSVNSYAADQRVTAPSDFSDTSNLPSDSAATYSSKEGGRFGESYQDILGETPIETIRKAGMQATGAAKSVGDALGQYIREKQRQNKQRELVYQFDQEMSYYLSRLDLTFDERRQLRNQVENCYIQDASSGAYKLDQYHFRDLSGLVKREYAEIVKNRTKTGAVETYYPNGKVKTQWTMKDGRADGPVTTYYEDGEILYIDIYKDGQRLSRKKYSVEGKLEFEQQYSYQVDEAAIQTQVRIEPIVQTTQKTEVTTVPQNTGMISVPIKDGSEDDSAS